MLKKVFIVLFLLPAIASYSNTLGASGVEAGPGKFKLKLATRLKMKVRDWHQTSENKKLTAATITLLAGPFGAHRLYLGTRPQVPVLYTCTLGGGLGILPAIDLGCILFSSDLSKFENNDRVVMWIDPKE